jgi:hypothetical protein
MVGHAYELCDGADRQQGEGGGIEAIEMRIRMEIYHKQHIGSATRFSSSHGDKPTRLRKKRCDDGR